MTSYNVSSRTLNLNITYLLSCSSFTCTQLRFVKNRKLCFGACFKLGQRERLVRLVSMRCLYRKNNTNEIWCQETGTNLVRKTRDASWTISADYINKFSLCCLSIYEFCDISINFISAVGCTNMIPPENAWLRRSNNDIIIGCYSSQQTWQLHCDGREWKGLVGTCPELCKLPVDLYPRVM